MKKILAVLLLFLAVGVAYAGFRFVENRYGEQPKLAVSLLDNCVNNVKQIVRSPSSYSLISAEIYVGGPHTQSDAEFYVSRNEFYEAEVANGRAEYVPMMVTMNFQADNSFGTSISEDAICRYAALEYKDGLFTNPTLMAVVAGNTLLRNPLIYEGGNISKWMNFSDDIREHESYLNYFKRYNAEIRTRFF